MGLVNDLAVMVIAKGEEKLVAINSSAVEFSNNI